MPPGITKGLKLNSLSEEAFERESFVRIFVASIFAIQQWNCSPVKIVSHHRTNPVLTFRGCDS
jgi:hypothetical protein